jgi:hypothetical protein
MGIVIPMTLVSAAAGVTIVTMLTVGVMLESAFIIGTTIGMRVKIPTILDCAFTIGTTILAATGVTIAENGVTIAMTEIATVAMVALVALVRHTLVSSQS